MNKYILTIEQAIQKERDNHEDKQNKLNTFLENGDIDLIRMAIDHALTHNIQNTYSNKEIAKISNALSWYDNDDAWKYFLNKLQLSIDAQKSFNDKRHQATTIATLLHIPIYQTSLFVDWMKSNDIAIEELPTKILDRSRHKFSIRALLMEQPTNTAKWLVQAPNHDCLRAILDTQLLMHDPNDIREILNQLAPHVVPYVSTNLTSIYDANPGHIEVMLHVHLALMSRDIDLQTSPSKPELTAIKHNVRAIKTWLSTDSLPSHISVSDQRCDRLRNMAYWLYPDHLNATKKPPQQLMDFTHLEHVCIDPTLNSFEFLQLHDYYKNNPQYTGLFLNILDSLSDNPAVVPKHAMTLKAIVENSRCTNMEWNKVLFEALRENNVDPIAQWFCDRFVAGVKWDTLQQQARVINTLSDTHESRDIWEQAFHIVQKEKTPLLELDVQHVVGSLD